MRRQGNKCQQDAGHQTDQNLFNQAALCNACQYFMHDAYVRFRFLMMLRNGCCASAGTAPGEFYAHL